MINGVLTPLNRLFFFNNQLSQRQPHQLPKIRHPKPSHRVPTLRRVPTRKRNHTSPRDRFSSLPIDTIAAHGSATRDVCQAFKAYGVEPRV